MRRLKLSPNSSAVATAGAIATAPFRGFDNSYNNYYGYGYGGRDWKTYAAHNGLACTPGTTFKGADGRQQLCQKFFLTRRKEKDGRSGPP